jgi:hypothetical protein
MRTGDVTSVTRGSLRPARMSVRVMRSIDVKTVRSSSLGQNEVA